MTKQKQKLKVLELFGGIGACSKALERLGVDFEIADYVEIDKYAVKSFNAMHGTNFEPQDITEWDKDIDVDLIMHGSPCQDFSVAGLGRGGDKDSGTRSSLMYETLRIVEKIRPRFVIWENVKGVLSKRHKHNFDAYQEAMEDLGYKNFYKVLNAKDFGVPQNRERVFTVSVLDDKKFNFPEREELQNKIKRKYGLYGQTTRWGVYDKNGIAPTITASMGMGGGHVPMVEDFEFPDPIPLTIKLKDVLDSEVDEKYYLTDKAVSKMRTSKFNQARARENKGDIAGTLCARDYKDPQVVRVGGIYDKDGERHQAGSVYDKEGLCPTMSTMGGGNQQPLIVDDMYANREPREYSKTAPTLRSERFGLKVAEPFVAASRGRGEKNEQQLEPRDDGNTNTITSVQKDNYVVEERLPGAYGRNFGSKGKIEDMEGESSTLQAAMGSGGGNVPLVTPGYRIRKLTPKECWRLMGFDDSDFAKAEQVNSNTQLYKQAGNSIVVNVLENILQNLICTRN